MGFFDKLEKSKGGYIFISHSHNDIEKVREIRNGLEKDGFEPLCFYLKCLNDDSEIEDLIKREIDAREWFVFVDSENARKSKWVTLEREYITKTNRKKILTVDIDDANDVFRTIQKMAHNLRVFISYSHHDVAVAKRIKGKLEEKDYLAFWDMDVSIDMVWKEQITSAIIDASKDGCVIVLITKNSLKSECVKYEVECAIRQGGNVIPILLGDVGQECIMKNSLFSRQYYCLPENPTDEEIEKVIDDIGISIVNK